MFLSDDIINNIITYLYLCDYCHKSSFNVYICNICYNRFTSCCHDYVSIISKKNLFINKFPCFNSFNFYCYSCNLTILNHFNALKLL